MAVLKLFMLRDSRIYRGSPFHGLGPETEKDRSPLMKDLVFILVICKNLCEADLKALVLLSVTK